MLKSETNNKGRGGDRGGRRPRVGPKRHVHLSDEQWAHVVKLGGGNGAAGVRKLIDADLKRPLSSDNAEK